MNLITQLPEFFRQAARYNPAARRNTVVSLRPKDEAIGTLTEVLRLAARHLIEQAVAEEFETFLAQHAHQRDAQGRAAVVRNGYLPHRAIATGIGTIEVRMPRVRDRLGAIRFRSCLVEPYVRQSMKRDAELAWLYLKSISTGNVGNALATLVGNSARMLPPEVSSRLKAHWAGEYELWKRRSLANECSVYLWGDRVYSGIQAEGERQCLLVVIGDNERAQRQFLAIAPGGRESIESWRPVVRDLRMRGLKMTPTLAAVEGASDFREALEEEFPELRRRHKMAEVLNHLPGSLHARAESSRQGRQEAV